MKPKFRLLARTLLVVLAVMALVLASGCSAKTEDPPPEEDESHTEETAGHEEANEGGTTDEHGDEGGTTDEHGDEGGTTDEHGNEGGTTDEHGDEDGENESHPSTEFKVDEAEKAALKEQLSLMLTQQAGEGNGDYAADTPEPQHGEAHATEGETHALGGDTHGAEGDANGTDAGSESDDNSAVQVDIPTAKIGAPSETGAHEGAGIAETAHGETPHWGYEGDAGPAHWGSLSAAYAICASGLSQSPIDIGTTQPIGLTDILFDYHPAPLTVVNNGHTIQANQEPGSAIEIDGKRYGLAQFHFHSPSEHTLLGNSLPMEMHLVHQNTSGELAVVGVMITQGGHNSAFDPVWADLPQQAGGEQTIEASVNALDLLPTDRRTYRYVGSLTTPPCTEGVKWLLLTNSIQVSVEQIAAFRAIMPSNTRPTEPLNDRPVFVDISVDG